MHTAENVPWGRPSHGSRCTEDGSKFWGTGQKLPTAGLQLTVSAASFNSFSHCSYTRSLSPPHLPTGHSVLHLQPPPSHPHAFPLPPLSCRPSSFSAFLFGTCFLLSLWGHFSSFFSNSCFQSLPPNPNPTPSRWSHFSLLFLQTF